jgi:hypothetical protein
MRRPLGLHIGVWIGTFAVAAVVAVLILRSTSVSHPLRVDTPPAVTVSPTMEATPSHGVPTSSPASVGTAVPTSAPSDISWSLFDGIALPSSSTAGPTRVDGAVHAGFAHTPEGALIADAQIAVRYLATPGTGWRDVLAQQVVPGPGVKAYSQERTAAGLGNVEHVDTAGVGQIVGFRFITYTPSVAVIQMAVRFPSSGQYQVATNTVDWLDGDWKLQLLPDGSSASTVQQVNDLAGFVPWSGVTS